MANRQPGTSSGGAAGGNEEGCISLNDFIEAECDLEDDARAVLGGSDPDKCTYNQGYMKRQALYACGTCTPMNTAPAGVCLACSLHCHDGHDLYELYTKRSFRCDCGNSKFSTACSLQRERDISNGRNKYNQNFRGVYCVCGRPYPDPDNDDDAEMIQCCMCEDWLHDNHLHLSAPVPTEYHEMICRGCVKQHMFLLNYTANQAQQSTVVESTDEKKEVSVTDSVKEEVVHPDSSAASLQSDNDTYDANRSAGSSNSDDLGATKSAPESDTFNEKQSVIGEIKVKPIKGGSDDDIAIKSEASGGQSGEPSASGTSGEEEEKKTDSFKSDATSKGEESDPESQKSSAVNINNSAEDKNAVTQCDKLRSLAESDCKTLFMLDGWREKLCRCGTCLRHYKSVGIEFLLDPEDPTHVYEQKSKSDSDQEGTSYDKGMDALSNLNRTQQIELISGYNDMKASLADYLKKFASNNKVVREEDIKEFFEEYKKNKRQRLAVPPSSCS